MRLSNLRRLAPLSIVLVTAGLVMAGLPDAPSKSLVLPLRTKVEAFKGSGDWREVRFRQELVVPETAILICDMWDNHWCSGAAGRVNEMVVRMAGVVDEARAHGVQIIHAPSDVMDFYEDYPQRKRMLEIPAVEPPPSLDLPDPPLPVDTSAGGCDTRGDKFFKAWTRQHEAIRIQPGDVISDKGAEVYSFLRRQGINNLLVMGVHTNMCILNRTFAIKQMTKWGVRCVLVRDLTDAMYDPNQPPFVSHERGTDLVIDHIEKHWCPTTLSSDLLEALRQAK
jgi:nicotinamidase-related amidase